MGSRDDSPACASADPRLLSWGSCGNGLIAHVLNVPGLDNSGPAHWQSLWEASPRVSRADLGRWSEPCLNRWVAALDAAIARASKPLLIVAHSLGCHAVAGWAGQCWTERLEGDVLGALLVAPADTEAGDTDPRVQGFGPIHRRELPFPSTVIASQDDRYAGLGRSRAMAGWWGSDFIDYGCCGHLNADSGLGVWPEGIAHLSRLQARAVRRRFDRLETDHEEEAAQ